MATDITRQQVDQLIRTGQFGEFLRELGGWDAPTSSQPIPITLDPPMGSDAAPRTFTLRPVVQKLEIVVYACAPGPDGRLPDHVTRRRIERELTAYAYLHLIIFHNASFERQIWQWTTREKGKPVRVGEAEYTPQKSEDLTQRLRSITFSLQEEETLGLVTALDRLGKAFDRDKVTKKFYDDFKTQRDVFEGFIDGLPDAGERSEYAALMLNRLMFVYFIQKKGFLDGDPDYLENRLRRVASGELWDSEAGAGFHSFYRQFLRRLFHEGLDRPAVARDPRLHRLIGEVPYLNGGFFEPKELERDNPVIDIPDAAFKTLLAFFGRYQWHLDDRPTGNDREINPDVLGYIFEKFINQKEMGAYYTKEDITGYICQNTILLWILDAARRDCRVAFDPAESDNVWRHLRDDPDRYLYPAVRHGVIDANGDVIPLPEEIAAGVDDVAQRGGWNRRADAPKYGLPTETWREHVHRRTRCLELREKLRAGEIHTVDDLVTWNLDIRQFTQDVVEHAEGVDLLRAMWKAVRDVTVLDPTCGSGAFLFAALQVLEPLHDACLTRMEGFVADLPADADPKRLIDFRNAISPLDDERHRNRRYYILRQIVLHNLYGVDIMPEAVEICKLRLFLKLVAQLDDAGQIEPLPDIDFNIRAGNTLVGFAREDEIRTAIDRERGRHKQLGLELSTSSEKADIFEKIQQADQAFARYQKMQDGTEDKADMQVAKADYRRRLDALLDKLDYYLAGQYPGSNTAKGYFEPWRERHQPFHWFVNFHGVISERGGFDAIVGNPPYVEIKASDSYQIRGYKTGGNLYAPIFERSRALVSPGGAVGLIVPLSGHSTARMKPLLDSVYFSFAKLHMVNLSGDANPSMLFQGVKFRLAIVLGSGTVAKQATPQRTSTGYLKWFGDERKTLFESVAFTKFDPEDFSLAPKLASPIESAIFCKLEKTNKKPLGKFLNGPCTTLYHNAPVSWIRSHSFVPAFTSERDGTKQSTQLKELRVEDESTGRAVSAVLSSSLFFMWWVVNSDCYHLNKPEIEDFPVDLSNRKLLKELDRLGGLLEVDLLKNAVSRTYVYATSGRVVYDEFYPKLSKRYIDQIDLTLGRELGLSDDETDYVIHYMEKYRMGREWLDKRS